MQTRPGNGPAPLESLRLRSEGHREQWTVEALPQVLLLAAENGPWNSAFLLVDTALSRRREGGWAGSIVGDVVHPPRPPRLRAWDRVWSEAYGRCQRQKIHGLALRTPVLAESCDLERVITLKAFVYLSMNSES